MDANRVVEETIRICMTKLKKSTTNIPDLLTNLYSSGVLDRSTYDKIKNMPQPENEKLEEALLMVGKKGFPEFKLLQNTLLETENNYSHQILKEEFDAQLANITSTISLNTNTQSPTILEPEQETPHRANVPDVTMEQPNIPSQQHVPSLPIFDTPSLLSETVHQNLVTFDVEFPNEVVSCESILEFLPNAKHLKKIAFTGVTFTGEFVETIVFPKLESVSFINCNLEPNTNSWKKMIFFSKKEAEACSNTTVENIWNMGIQISITCDGSRLLHVDHKSGSLIVHSTTGIDLAAILTGMDSASHPPLMLKSLEAVGFQPSKLVFTKCPDLRDLHLLEIEIGVLKDMVALRGIFKNTANLRSLHCSVGINRYSPGKRVVVFLSNISVESIRTLLTLKMLNLDLKHSDGKTVTNGPKFPRVTSCEFKKCTLNGPLRDRFRKVFPLINRTTSPQVLVECTDEAGKFINLTDLNLAV